MHGPIQPQPLIVGPFGQAEQAFQRVGWDIRVGPPGDGLFDFFTNATDRYSMGRPPVTGMTAPVM